MLADTAKLVVDLSLKGNFATSLGKATRDLGKFDAQVDRTATRAYRAGQQIGNGIKNATRLAAGVTATLGAFTVASAKVAADFESQLNTINTVARQTPEALGKIGDTVRKIARDTGTATEELTQGYYDLVSAGISAADATNVLEAANRLAIGGLASTAETVDLLTTAINTYGGDATKASKIADVFAKSIERGKVTAADLAASFAQVGPIAAASGIEIEELGAAYARLTAAGVPATVAAIQVRSAIVALTKRTGDLEKLEKATGKSYLSIAGSRGLVVALEEMRKDAEKSGVPLVNLLGRVEGLNFTLATTGPNFEKYTADLKAMGDASGTAAEQMSERQKGLNFQLARIKALVKDAQISLGTALLPALTKAADAIAKTLADPKIGQALKDLGTEIAGLFTEENIKAGIGAIREIAPLLIQTARTMGTVVGAAVSLFRSLPPEIQRLAIGAFAINKLTGGLVTNIAGGLISSVLKQLVSGVVNVSGAVVNVAGGPGLIGDVAPSAGRFGRLGGIVKATIVGAVVVEGFSLWAESVARAVDKNNAIQEAAGGTLTAAEIEAKKYYEGDARYQAEVQKRLGRIPSRADYESALAKALDRNQSLRFMANASKDDQAILTGIGKTVSVLQTQMHADFQTAIGALQESNDPQKIAEAANRIVELTRSGVGSATTTGGAIADLVRARDAAVRTGNKDLAALLSRAIGQLEPFRKGRQWQQEQLRKAEEIRRSNKSVEQKTRELKDIQRDLLRHQRRMAADIVTGLLEVVAAVRNIRINGVAAIIPQRGMGPSNVIDPRPRPRTVTETPRSTEDRGALVNVKVVNSIKDTNTAQDVRLRWGKTPTQVGASA